jgi:hypothetical protein
MLVKSDIDEINIDTIIDQLGKFDSSEGLLKMYARRGQCFTTTKYITKLSEHEIIPIDDIKTPKLDDPYDPDGFYTFTDG